MNTTGDRTIDEMLAVVEKFQPGATARFEQRRRLDPAMAIGALRYAARLFGRPILDVRSRLLVMTGQYTMARRHRRLRETITAACNERIDMKEVLEVIFQCSIYGGESIMDEPLEIFTEVIAEHGLLDGVAELGLKEGQREAERELASERALWHPEDRADRRADALMDRYGWAGISMALVLRPQHTLNNAEFLASLDEDFTKEFYDFAYNGLYARMVLDHKTRLLCMVGNTLAIGETVQCKHHMRTALKQGAEPREVLEVLFQSVVTIGHPNIVPERFRDFVSILENEGRNL
jgi:alkylhydroperoxidase/carboxymuconolactone decarboxylase family protein YurZ